MSSWTVTHMAFIAVVLPPESSWQFQSAKNANQHAGGSFVLKMPPNLEGGATTGFAGVTPHCYRHRC